MMKKRNAFLVAIYGYMAIWETGWWRDLENGMEKIVGRRGGFRIVLRPAGTLASL
jgi:hypothetical protein